MRVVASIVALALMATAPAALFAHGGGLNAAGCHNNRKTGDYHCHRPQTSKPSQTAQPQQLRGGGRQRGAYRNCTEAREAGAAPVLRGEPGYGPHLDRDGDGIGCE